MKRNLCCYPVAGLGLILLALTASAADEKPATPGDWPQWRGPRRDGVSQETGLLTQWPRQGPKELWRAPASVGYSTFAVAGGRVYTILQDGEQEAIVCWQADTGKELWRFRYPARYVNDWGSGPRSTPTVDGDFVYTVGATGLFHCLKAATGEKVWQHKLLEQFGADNLTWGVSFSPLVEGDLVYTNPGGPGGNSLAAFHKRTGKLVWKAQNDVAGYSSPITITAAGVRQTLFFTGKHLLSVALDTGQLYWSIPWETEYDCNVATPIAVGDHVFISSGYNRGCTLLKIESDGKTLKPRRIYENTQMCNHFSSCVYYQGHLYGFNEGMLSCLDFLKGKTAWRERGFNKGALMIADGHLIILGENGKLALAEASPHGYKEKARFQFSENKCWTVPVLANGRLYVRDEEKIVCYDVRKR
jgi:outer membrane protein assembly factor BamB